MNENQALGSALGTDMQPAPFKEPNYKDLQTLPQVFAEQQRIGNLKAEAAGELKRAELLQQANTASEQAKAAGEVLDKYKGYIDENKKKRAEFPFPEFHPTQDNASSLAGLFSIVSVLGMGLGNSGKQSALNAMNAMSGMMSGWQKGRADLFKYEKEVFDKEFNRIKVIHDDLRKDLSELMQLMPIDKEKAMYKAAELSAKAGSNSIIGTYVRTGRLQEASNLLDSMAKMIQHREDKALQRELAAMKGKKAKDKEVSQVEGLDSMAQGLEQLKKDFKPEYASLGVLGFGSDAVLEYKRRFGDKKANDAVSWWSRYEQMQAPNRHSLFGATLTGNELKSYQKFTAKPSDSPETVKSMLQDQINYTQGTASGRRRALESAGYSLPEATPRDYFGSFSGGQERAETQEGGWTEEKERRYQELLNKQKQGS